MPASKSIDALRRSILALRPGATIWGIGDQAHQQIVSGHNEDDTAGVRAELQDADALPEYRAIDVKIDDRFSRGDAAALVVDITTWPANQDRAYYVIFNRRIYRRATGYASEPYTGDNPHTTHVHVSGHDSDDSNGAAWFLPHLKALGAPPMSTADQIAQLQRILAEIVNANESTERQVRDMITGGRHSLNPTGWGLLSPIAVTLADVLDELTRTQAAIAVLNEKVDRLLAGPADGHTHTVSGPVTDG